MFAYTTSAFEADYFAYLTSIEIFSLIAVVSPLYRYRCKFSDANYQSNYCKG